MRVVVYHQGYGCGTGCCGHTVELDSEESEFFFDHPYNESHAAFIEHLVTEAFGQEHVKDIDWENCLIVED